jgi:hypothetical protein
MINCTAYSVAGSGDANMPIGQVVIWCRFVVALVNFVLAILNLFPLDPARLIPRLPTSGEIRARPQGGCLIYDEAVAPEPHVAG